MTTFGQDASHYDAPPTARDGIDFYAHKLTDGDHFYLDVEYGAAVTAARDLGVPILGAYHVLHGRRSLANQADWLIAQADATTPWWRGWPYWVWQIDAEPFPYLTAPTIDEVNTFADLVCARSDCPASAVLAYTPAWHYGQALTGLRYRYWHSSYVSGTGPYQTLYPGDRSIRWAAPVDPLILQYTSGAVIAGQTTCDANAYRGTLNQLMTVLNGGIMGLTDTEANEIILGQLTSRNALYAWLRGIATGMVPTQAAPGVLDWNNMVPAGYPGLPQIAQILAAMEAREVARDAALAELVRQVLDLAGNPLSDAQFQQALSAIRDAARTAADAATAALQARLAAAVKAEADTLAAGTGG